MSKAGCWGWHDERQRPLAYHGRKGEKKGFGIPELQALVRSADHLLGGPIAVVGDNLSAHVGSTMRAFINAHADWLTVFRLPPYAPEFNPAEGVWANLKGRLFNLAPSASTSWSR
ncbi:transposase [Microbispora rosea]|uniref:transposase n=1 Tax=Microbispora rosea TaxID=58117 RepID=UPI003D89D185